MKETPDAFTIIKSPQHRQYGKSGRSSKGGFIIASLHSCFHNYFSRIIYVTFYTLFASFLGQVKNRVFVLSVCLLVFLQYFICDLGI